MNYKKDKLSIILNYGCQSKCPYCIWEGHRLQKVNSSLENFNFKALDTILESNHFSNAVSISGGGEPLLFKQPNNEVIFKKIISILKNHHQQISVHTHMQYKGSLMKEFDQIVLSYNNLNERGLKDYLSYLDTLNLKVRIAKVAIEEEYAYERDIEFAMANDYQITFYPKDKEKQPWFDAVISKCNEYYNATTITTGNNKTYFMPDNKLYNDYIASERYKPLIL